MDRARSAPGEIALLLPHGEQFGPQRAGAIALHVRDVTRASRLRARIRIYGAPLAEPFAGFDFRPLHPAWHGLRGRNIGLAEALARQLRGRDDVMVEVYNRPNMLAHLAGRAPALPLILRLSNDPSTMRSARTPGERAQLLARARAILCVSDYVRGRFLAGLDAAALAHAAHKLQVTHNAIPRRLAVPPPKERLVLFVGRIIEAKGVADLVSALERVLPRHPAWRAAIIGTSRTRRNPRPSAFESAVGERCARLGAAVRWLGQLPNEAALAYFAQAAIVVVPSRWQEPLARTAIEGLAHGCAVLAYATGGLPEVLQGRGLLIEPSSAEALTVALERVIADDALRADLQHRAWHDYPFDIAPLAARIDALRETILAGPSKAA